MSCTNTFNQRSAFSYAIERGWCNENPVLKVKKVKTPPRPKYLPRRNLLDCSKPQAKKRSHTGWLVGFAGLRRGEIERLEWKYVHFDLAKYRAYIKAQALTSGDKQAIENAKKAVDAWRQSALIEVPALKAKTASRRFVQIQDNLAAWLEPYIGQTGPVCPSNLRKLLENDRTNTGIWIGPENPAEEAPKADRQAGKLKPWPSNGLRHV